MTRRNSDHVVYDMERQALSCQHCGASYKMTLPAPINMVAAMMKEYVKAHRNCTKEQK